MITSPQPRTLKKGVLFRFRKFWENEGGATAIAMGLMSPVIIGGMALGGETGYWYYTQRKLQHAADVAAHAAAVRKRAGDSGNGLDTAAIRVASASGFQPSLLDIDPDPVKTQWIATNLVVNNPPQSGTWAKNNRAFEVVLSETKPRLLSSIFSKEPVEVRARAVAMLSEGSPACVLALSPTRPKAVEVSGNTTVTLNDCSVAANSDQPDAYYMPNSTAELTADCISTFGGASIKDPTAGVLTLKKCESAQTNAPLVPDPYGGVAEPGFSGAPCRPRVVSGTIEGDSHPVYGKLAVYCNGIEVASNATATFTPGLYVISGGGMKINNKATLIATEATFFFANNTTADIDGSANLQLSAPTEGQFSGLVFFGARCTDSPLTCGEVFKINGNSSTTSIKGAIYLPGSSIEFLGSTDATSSCLQIIADKVTFTGRSTITAGAACAGVGTSEVRVGQTAQLVE